MNAVISHNIPEVSSEYHLRLAAMGNDTWNRWALTKISDEDLTKLSNKILADKNGEKLKKLSDEELANLHKKLGLENGQSLDVDVKFNSISTLANEFSYLIFPGKLYVTQLKIQDDDYISFSHSHFLGHVIFNKAEFLRGVNFDSAIFYDCVEFQNVNFSKNKGQGQTFVHTEFRNKAIFSKSVFNQNTNFHSSKFLVLAEFIDTIFLGSVDFRDAHFEGNTTFEGSAFKEGALFEKSIFSNQVYFSGATFCKEVSFNHGTFEFDVSFKKAKFENKAIFTNTNFNNVSFNQTEFHEVTEFSCATFNSTVSFENSNFKDIPSFEGATFYSAPCFHETEIKQGTSFHNVTWKQSTGIAHKERDAWRTLKQAMNKVHDHEQELLFFTFEMNAKIEVLEQNIKDIKIEGSNYLEKLYSWGSNQLQLLPIRPHLLGLKLYKWLSHYGSSILRPLLCLFALFLIFSGIYALPGWGIPAMDFSKALQFSWANMLPFTSMSKAAITSLDLGDKVGLCLQITTAVQNILSAGFIFLTGLAIKHKLSMK